MLNEHKQCYKARTDHFSDFQSFQSTVLHTLILKPIFNQNPTPLHTYRYFYVASKKSKKKADPPKCAGSFSIKKPHQSSKYNIVKHKRGTFCAIIFLVELCEHLFFKMTFTILSLVDSNWTIGHDEVHENVHEKRFFGGHP